MALEESFVILFVDFVCGSDAGEKAAQKSWFGWKNNSLLWSNLKRLQDVVMEVAVAGTSTYGYLVQEGTKNGFIFWLICVVKVESQCFDVIFTTRSLVFNSASFFQLRG